MRKSICNCLIICVEHLNYYPFKLISKDTQLQIWNFRTEPDKSEWALVCPDELTNRNDFYLPDSFDGFKDICWTFSVMVY